METILKEVMLNKIEFNQEENSICFEFYDTLTGDDIGKVVCKNIFKEKYLQLLEEYKMELTELYIESGYPYDEFFCKN